MQTETMFASPTRERLKTAMDNSALNTLYRQNLDKTASDMWGDRNSEVNAPMLTCSAYSVGDLGIE